MKKSIHNPLRKLLVLTAVLVLLAAMMTGCETGDPRETINNLPTDSQPATEAPTDPPTEAPTDPPADAIMGTVTTDNLNIRSNPSTDSTVITQLAVSTRVQIFERKTINGVPWGRIEEGWINLNYVAIDGEDNTPPTEPEATEPPVVDDEKDDGPVTGSGTTGTITADSLNIRSGAGSKYDMVGKYYKGDKVTILETKNGWGKTDKGWISMNYVKTSGSNAGSNSGSVGTGDTGTITADALYIREGAGNSYDTVGKYYKGDKVTILETKDGWGKTDKGWIYLGYVSGYSGSSNSSGSSDDKKPVNFTGSGTVTASSLNIRKDAGSKYDKVGEYAKGDKVTILESKNGWGKTDKGWISLSYVKPDSSASVTGTGTITAGSLHIREGAGTSYDSIGEYVKGDKVTILETKDGWGKTDKGWISMKYVDMD